MIETLKHLQKQRILTSLYCNIDDLNEYSVGYIDHVSSEYVSINSVSKYGEVCGYEVRLIRDICKIEYDGKYENNIEFLICNKLEFQNNIIITYDDDHFILGILEQIIKTNCMCVLWMGDQEDSVTGTVESVNDDIVSVNLTSEFGGDDGQALIRVLDITNIDINTKSEQYLQRISNQKL